MERLKHCVQPKITKARKTPTTGTGSTGYTKTAGQCICELLLDLFADKGGWS